MFSGFFSKKTSINSIEDRLEDFSHLGVPNVINKNHVTFVRSETLFVQKTKVDLFINSKEELILNFTYTFNPNILSWIIGLCFFPLGFLIFIIPNKEKDEFEMFLANHEF